MNKTALDLLAGTNIEIDLQNFVINLFIVGILSYFIKLLYIRFSTTLSNREEFSKNFVILGITTCIVITVVKNSLALSLGLVGALSIVRFRAAIKEPEELVYLFLIIATGLGAGAGQIKITVYGILFSGIIIFFNSLLRTKEITKSGVLNLGIITKKRINEFETNKILAIVQKNIKELKFVSLSSTDENTTINLNIKAKDTKQLSRLTNQINKNYPSTKVIISQNDDLAI